MFRYLTTYINMPWLFKSDMVRHMATVDALFTAEECQQIIDLGRSKDKIQAQVSVNNQNIDVESVRKSQIAWVNVDEESKWIYQRIADAVIQTNQRYFNFDLHGFIDDLQFTEYTAPDNNYDLHVDTIYGGITRKLSVVLQLTNPGLYQGGNLELHVGTVPQTMSKQQGTLIVFPSYVLHKVTPVTHGIRHSLVGWVSGPQFK